MDLIADYPFQTLAILLLLLGLAVVALTRQSKSSRFVSLLLATAVIVGEIALIIWSWPRLAVFFATAQSCLTSTLGACEPAHLDVAVRRLMDLALGIPLAFILARHALRRTTDSVASDR